MSNNNKYQEACIRTYNLTLGAGARGVINFTISQERELVLSHIIFNCTAQAFTVSFNSTKNIFEQEFNLNASIINQVIPFELLKPVAITGASQLRVHNISNVEDTLSITLNGKITSRGDNK